MWANLAIHEIFGPEIDLFDLLKPLDLRLRAGTEIGRSGPGKWKLVVGRRKVVTTPLPEGRGFWAPAFRHGLLQQARVVPRGECFLRHLRRDHEPHRNRRKSSLLFAGLRYLSASKCRAIRTPNRSG